MPFWSTMRFNSKRTLILTSFITFQYTLIVYVYSQSMIKSIKIMPYVCLMIAAAWNLKSCILIENCLSVYLSRSIIANVIALSILHISHIQINIAINSFKMRSLFWKKIPVLLQLVANLLTWYTYTNSVVQ